MSIAIQDYVDRFVPAVKAFNERLRSAHVSFQFPERSTSNWLPPIEGREIYEQYFVAVDHQEHVRGAYILKYQPFVVQGETITVAHFDLPIAEGYVDKAYSMVGVQLLMSALKRQPLLFSLGIGGFDEALAQLLKGSGWTLWAVPFFFRVNHAAPFLRNVNAVRGTAVRRCAADIAAWTGAGQVAFQAVHWWRRAGSVAGAPLHADDFDRFGAWADDLWEACRNEYALCTLRDRETLNILYAPGKRDPIRICARDDSRVLGWAVALDTEMRRTPHFGNLRVGTIVDCLALKKDAALVIRAATETLFERGVDIVITNQGDEAWGNACRANGFLEAPSNYIFAGSKKLIDRIQPLDANRGRVHMTRGDGAGPINL